MVIGLLGRVGSGKSHIASVLETHFKCDCIDLDKVGHALLEEDYIKSKLLSLFGEGILNPDASISRPKLGELVFSQESKLKALNTLMHPAMKEKVLTYLKETKSEGKVFLMIGALIEEIGLLPYCDKLLVIDAEDSDIEARVGTKFSISQHQKSRSHYLEIAHSIVHNRYTSQSEQEAIRIFKELF